MQRSKTIINTDIPKHIQASLGKDLLLPARIRNAKKKSTGIRQKSENCTRKPISQPAEPKDKWIACAPAEYKKILQKQIGYISKGFVRETANKQIRNGIRATTIKPTIDTGLLAALRIISK